MLSPPTLFQFPLTCHTASLYRGARKEVWLGRALFALSETDWKKTPHFGIGRVLPRHGSKADEHKEKSMFAVIKTGGKQYRVAPDDLLKVEKLAGEAGDIVEIGHVLVVGNGDDTTIGVPYVDGAMVTAEVVDQGRDRKVIAFKKRRRQNSRRTIGHRQHQTLLRINEILTGGA